MVEDAVGISNLKRNAGEPPTSPSSLINTSTTSRSNPPTHLLQDPLPTKTYLEEGLLQERNKEEAVVVGPVGFSNKADLKGGGGGARIRKKSEEGGKSNRTGGNRKQNGIPVGIAVAWQRHVTSTGTSSTTTTTTTTSKKYLHPTGTMSSPPPPKRKRSPVSPKVSVTIPGSTGGDVRNGREGTKGHHFLHDRKGQHYVAANKVPKSNGHEDRNVTEEKGEAFQTDISSSSTVLVEGQVDLGVTPVQKPSNSYIPNTGYNYNNPYGDWTSQYFVPNSSQQSYNAMMTAYLQQLSMHHQQQPTSLQYSYNSSSYLYSGDNYTPDQLHQYDRLVLKRQQEEFERSQAEQRQLGEFDLRPPLPTLSPRISIPSPSPNSPQGPSPYATPYPAHQPWLTSDLYHHHYHHPMTFISSATLSPRSLASSTPSPITTYEAHTQSYLYHRKCITPNPPPTPLKPFGLFSPPLYHGHTPLVKDNTPAVPVSLVTHGRRVVESPSPTCENNEKSMEIPAAAVVPVGPAGNSTVFEKSIVVKPEKTFVDFSRLESLIEKRGGVRNSHTKREKRTSTVEKTVRKRRERDCNGNEMKVPDECSSGGGSVVFRKLDHNNETIRNNINQSELETKFTNQSELEEENSQYFLPIDAVKLRNGEKVMKRENNDEEESYTLELEAVPLLSNNTSSTTQITNGGGGIENFCDNEEIDDVDAKIWPKNNGDGARKINASGDIATTTFPKLVIPSGETHLNLLATVAQEIGPYISLLPNHGHSQNATSPRRFEGLIIENELSDEESIEVRVKELKEEELTGTSITEPSASILEDTVTVSLPLAPPLSPPPPPPTEPFQLKIPTVVPRPVKELKKLVTKPRRIKLLSNLPEVPRKVKKIKTEGLKPKKVKTILANQKVEKSGQVDMISQSGDDTDTASVKVKTEVAALPERKPSPKPIALPNASIYDFEADDGFVSEFETFKHFNTSAAIPPPAESSGTKTKPKLSMLSHLYPTATKKSHMRSKSMTSDLARKDLKPKHALSIDQKKKVVTKMKSDKLISRGNSTGEESRASKSTEEMSKVKLIPLKVKEKPIRSNPAAILNLADFVSSVAVNTDSNDSFSRDSSSSAWTTNPALAVTAIKVPGVDKSTKNKKRAKVISKKVMTTQSVDELKVKKSSHEVRKKLSSNSLHHHMKPCLKAEPVRIQNRVKSDDEEEEELLDLDEPPPLAPRPEPPKPRSPKIRKPSVDMNIFSRRVKSVEGNGNGTTTKEEERLWPANVVICGVDEMVNEMRVLTEIEGLFYTGKLNALQPPDVYGVTLDNERGAPPHMIFSAEEVLEKCIREAKPWKPSQLPHGLRICAYWSPMYSGLYPGHVSTDYDLTSDLVPVEFDDGDTGVIKICEIRLLAPSHPMREYDPNPLLTLEKKHRKRRHSSAGGAVTECSGEHDEDDCGESYCAKIAKLEETEGDEEEFDNSTSKFKYWTWTGLAVKQPKTKQNRHKEFFRGIQRGQEVINVGDSAIFISDQQNRRPFLGRVENFWEKKGLKSVTVRWFYHPEEAKTNKKMPPLKYPSAVFESPHTDDNDVQTIAKKCEVLNFKDFKAKYGQLFTTGGKSGKSHKATVTAALKNVYYVAGFYDPCARQLKMNDLK